MLVAPDGSRTSEAFAIMADFFARDLFERGRPRRVT